MRPHFGPNLARTCLVDLAGVGWVSSGKTPRRSSGRQMSRVTQSALSATLATGRCGRLWARSSVRQMMQLT
eukprot:396602-Pyramimonas_sp.AAC.1